MYTVAILVSFILIRFCSSQLKACYQATNGEVAGDFPCDPDANVSSCCASGNICSSNLYCISAENQQKYVGTCTDKTWSSPACPFNLTSGGKFNGWYDKFNYQLNTTQCPDGSLCPSANNKPCCDANEGIREVFYDYNSSAAMPANQEQLTPFYAAAGYKFPTSIPPMHLALPLTSSSYPLAPPEYLDNTEMATTNLTASLSASHAHTKATASITPRASSDPSSASSTAASLTTPTAPSGHGLVHSTSSASGLSPGSKAGITVGITLSVVLCSACVLFLSLHLRRRRRHGQQVQPQSHQQQNRSDTPKELASSQITPIQGYSAELAGTPIRPYVKESRYTQKLHE